MHLCAQCSCITNETYSIGAERNHSDVVGMVDDPPPKLLRSAKEGEVRVLLDAWSQ